LLRSYIIVVGSWKFVGLLFMFAAANEMNFEIPSEIKAVTAQSCRSG
jgi:hypothetical protein